MDPVNAERNAVPDDLEATGAALTPRSVIQVAVGPLARQPRTPEGRRYQAPTSITPHPGHETPVNPNLPG